MMKQMVLAVSLLCLSSLAAAKGNKTGERKGFESTVITFESGQSTLYADDLTKIKNTLARAEAAGKVGVVEIAVWSDKDYPVSGALSKEDRQLADTRTYALKEALHKDLTAGKWIKAYNMADGGNWLTRTLNTSEAELDSVFAKDDSTSVGREDFDLIKREGGPGKAVVIVEVKNK